MLAAPASVDEIDPGFSAFLTENGYRDARPLGNGTYACICPLLYTHAIITGQVGDVFGYDDRWCFHSYGAAKAALDAWDGEGEPPGWHRHPASGRRRPDGDATLESIDR